MPSYQTNGSTPQSTGLSGLAGLFSPKRRKETSHPQSLNIRKNETKENTMQTSGQIELSKCPHTALPRISDPGDASQSSTRDSPPKARARVTFMHFAMGFHGHWPSCMVTTDNETIAEACRLLVRGVRVQNAWGQHECLPVNGSAFLRVLPRSLLSQMPHNFGYAFKAALHLWCAEKFPINVCVHGVAADRVVRVPSTAPRPVCAEVRACPPRNSTTKGSGDCWQRAGPKPHLVHD